MEKKFILRIKGKIILHFTSGRKSVAVDQSKHETQNKYFV